MKRRAFTLVEIMVALVVTGLVVSLAYATVQAGLDTAERLTIVQAGEEREAVARTLLATALRHALPGTIGGQPIFVLRDQPDGDELTFRTRGIAAPYGATASWDVALRSSDDGVIITGIATNDTNKSYAARLPRVRRIDVRVMGRDARDGWLTTWDFFDRSPVAVSIAFIDKQGRQIGVPLIARVGLEGNR